MIHRLEVDRDRAMRGELLWKVGVGAAVGVALTAIFGFVIALVTAAATACWGLFDIFRALKNTVEE